MRGLRDRLCDAVAESTRRGDEINIFAFTEFCLAPGFISINRDDNGQHSITVRETGKDGNIGPVVTFNCTRDVLQMMAVAISKAEKPESVPGICNMCGKPMPKGEEMFKYHGLSGPCPS